MEAVLSFAGKNLLFSISIILISFVVGWFLYSIVIVRKINLKAALFDKDNLAAWIEFIGAFIFPTLYLSAKAVEGSASDNFSVDLAICLALAVLYIGIFTLLRLVSGILVSFLSPKDTQGKIRLNEEIFAQKNSAAALFSVALSIIFSGMITFLDISSLDNFFISLFQMGDILIFSLVAVIVYSMILRRKTSLFSEIFVDNNIAEGFRFAGFVLAVAVILYNLVNLQQEFDFIELALLSGVGLMILGVVAIAMKWVFTKLIKVDLRKEVYEQNNLGAAMGQVALYVGIANVIIHFIK